MSVAWQRKTDEYVLDNDYEINEVSLYRTVKEHTHRFIELVYTFSGKGFVRRFLLLTKYY